MQIQKSSKPMPAFLDQTHRRNMEGSPTMTKKYKSNLCMNNSPRLLKLGVLILLGVGQISFTHTYAATIVKAHSFSPGTSISSSKVNANFDQLVTELNAKEARLGEMESRMTSTLTSSVAPPQAGGRTVRDSTGTVLGTLVNFDGLTLTILSPTQFFYQVKSNGSLVSQYTYYNFSDSGCTSILGLSYSDHSIAANFLIINQSGAIYRATNVNTDGTAQAISHGGSYYYFMTGTCNASSGPVNLIPLTPMTRTEAGIPVTIAPPFSYQ